MNIYKLSWLYYSNNTNGQMIRMSRKFRNRYDVEPITAAKNASQYMNGLIFADTVIFLLWRYLYNHNLFIKTHFSLFCLLVTFFVTGCIYGFRQSKNIKVAWSFCRAFRAVRKKIKDREMGDFDELLNSDSDHIDRSAFLALKLDAQEIKKLQAIPWREADAIAKRDELVRKIALFNLVVTVPTDLTEYFED